MRLKRRVISVMNEKFVEILNEIFSVSHTEKLALLESTFEQLKPSFEAYDPEHDGSVILNIVLSTAIVIDGASNIHERVAAKRVLSLAEVDISEAQFAELMNKCNKDAAFKVVLDFAKQLSQEQRGILFTFVATLCAYDNDLDEAEVGFLYDIVNE